MGRIKILCIPLGDNHGELSCALESIPIHRDEALTFCFDSWGVNGTMHPEDYDAAVADYFADCECMPNMIDYDNLAALEEVFDLTVVSQLYAYGITPEHNAVANPHLDLCGNLIMEVYYLDLKEAKHDYREQNFDSSGQRFNVGYLSTTQ